LKDGGVKQIKKILGAPLPLCALVLIAFSGCASSGYKSASGTDIDAQVYADAQRRVVDEKIPEPLRAEFTALYSEGQQNSVLHSMRAGLTALRLGEYGIARRLFDGAIRDVEALQAGAAQAERAASKFVGDREKWFKGESYERSALYFYRGLLYLRDGDFGNAAACFKRSELEDITGDDAPGFSGDWYSDELGLALASYWNGYPADADAALRRAATYHSIQGKVPPPTPLTNTLLVVEVGAGPIKYAAGRYHEQLRFREEPPATVTVSAAPPGRSSQSAAAENLYFQATTRGARQVDYILDGKANFKEGAGVAAVALGVGAIAVADSHADRSGIASGALALAAVGAAITSALTTPEADIRSWDNLPHSIFLLNLALPAGATGVTVSGLDAQGRATASAAVSLNTVTVSGGKKFNLGFARFSN
jgi:tetratricopeptide (TPR) repeat protein